ncbi:cytochrome P450 [Aspergillus affinis]|uniref:cytochrome P450 n=1 Tax=Aspergillus affinis TaxID=1070780 RepID=UPI0022FE2CEA|nr:uncharacterized protein KD926_006382 [Aspergillus affinis]KAI9041837.1 hypothetical protein KD926_006382 [Aspergillus affinis]
MWKDMKFLILFAGGVLSHITYFARGEHHLSGAPYLQVFALVFTALTLVSHGAGNSIQNALRQTLNTIFSYLVGVFFSLVVYRMFLHPLRTFPGPIWARLSGLWLTWRVRRRDGFRQVKCLHNQYGSIVRVGPTDLSIAHPSAVEVVHGFGTECTKGPWYDGYRPMVSLHTYRSKVDHDRRRRVWSTAFGDRAIRGYEQRLHKYRKQLLDQIVAHEGQPMSVTKWFYSYSFDVLGDLAFGKSFNMLETGREHWAVTMINEGVQTDAQFQSIGSALASPLRGPSETTAVVLSLVIYELARHPEHLEKLRQELAPYVSESEEEILNSDIQHLEHLEAVIMEVLRLYPPVPTQMQRKTPPAGISVEGIHIPGNTSIWTPLYAIGRSQSAYQEPDQFIPERWTIYPEMVRDKTAFAPFSTGTFNCIGKPLALLNIRTTIAKVISSFDFALAPGEENMLVDDIMTEGFSTTLGDLMIVFKKRQGHQIGQTTTT